MLPFVGLRRLAFQFRQPLWMRRPLSCTKSLKVSTDFACALSDFSAKGSGSRSTTVCQYCCNGEESGFISDFILA
ncbi:hypothetical protein ACLBR5_07260 [Escherichia coli]